jgi:valyl-tRNA synthetase
MDQSDTPVSSSKRLTSGKRVSSSTSSKQATLLSYFSSPNKSAKAAKISSSPPSTAAIDRTSVHTAIVPATSAPPTSTANSVAVNPRDPPYRLLADTLVQLVETTSRLRIVALLAETYTKVFEMTKDESGK